MPTTWVRFELSTLPNEWSTLSRRHKLRKHPCAESAWSFARKLAILLRMSNCISRTLLHTFWTLGRKGKRNSLICFNDHWALDSTVTFYSDGQIQSPTESNFACSRIFRNLQMCQQRSDVRWSHACITIGQDENVFLNITRKTIGRRSLSEKYYFKIDERKIWRENGRRNQCLPLAGKRSSEQT